MTAGMSDKARLKKTAKAFAKDGFVEVREFLDANEADGLRNLGGRVPPWRITFREHGAPITLSGRQRQSLTERRWRDKQNQAFELTRREHQFHYLIRPLLNQDVREGFPDDPFPGLMKALETSEFGETIAEITGEPGVKLQSCDALLLGFNNFRSRMRYAENGASEHHFVLIDLTPEWKPDWGGLVQFYDDGGDISGGLLPRFNSLIVIRKDKDFGISFIPSFVEAQRYLVLATFAAE